ncbi:retrovirus-related pol polyprotein from transposon TNT 1-94 [Tanacetum coccineum]
MGLQQTDQQKALDDSLIAPENRLKIHAKKCNQRLSPTLKSNEPTIQVALGALKLTPFYNAFDDFADVPKIYMQEDMLKICPKLQAKNLKILHLKRRYSLSLEILDTLCLSGKTTALESLCLSRSHKQTELKFFGEYSKTQICQNKVDSEASPKKKTATTAKGKRLKTSANAAKPAKKKQPAKTSKAKGLTVLSEVALTEAEQMKLATKRSLIETHSSHASGSGANEGTSSKPGVPNVPTYGSDDEEISWKSSNEEDDDEVGLNDDDDDNDDDEDNDDDDDDADNQDDDGQDDEDQDDVNDQTDSDNDGDDFVHPKLSTQDQKVRHSERKFKVRMLRDQKELDEKSKMMTGPANLSELELKKILIDKIKSNKSIYRSDEQKNLYKALVDTYENDEDKDEEPSAGSKRGSKKRRAGKEPESTSASKEKTSKTTVKSTEGSKSHHKFAGESAQAEEPRHTTKDLEQPAHLEFKTGVTKDQPDKETSQLPDCSLAQMEDLHESFNELMDTPLDFSAFVMNRLKVDTLTQEIISDPKHSKLTKGHARVW